MQLTELKKMPVEQLIELGEECGIENASRAKRQDIVFGILKSKAKKGEDIEGEGVLEILQDGFDFVVDAIDNVQNKVLLISECCLQKIPIITSGAAGGRLDGTRVQVTDLAKTTHDPLLSKVRSSLRKDHDFPRSGKKMGVRCVFSPESAVYPKKDGTVCSSRSEVNNSENPLKLNCEWGLGSATFVTGAFGFAVAGEVVRHLTSE